MATPIQSALCILNAAVHDLGLKAGDEIPDHELRLAFEKRGGRVDEIAQGLEFAHARGWVNHDGGPAKGHFTLATAGVATVD